jgi:hypothetical protein
MVEYIIKKENLRDISCKMRDAGFNVSFWDCPARGGTGGHPMYRSAYTGSIRNRIKFNRQLLVYNLDYQIKSKPNQ